MSIPIISSATKWFLVCVITVTVSCIACSQTTDTPFSSAYLSVEDGLSQSTVTSIIQDRDGFLWFATTDGLNRYDGSAFTVFKHDQNNPKSLPTNILAPLAFTGQGTLWIGTLSGLCRYDKSTNEFSLVPIHSSDSTIPAESQISELLADRDGQLWVGTRHGLMTIQSDSTVILPKNINNILSGLSQGERVYALYEDRRNIVWIGVGKRLLAYQKLTGEVENVAVPGDPATIESIYEDSFGVLWFGTDDARLLRYDVSRDSMDRRSRLSEYPVGSAGGKAPLGNHVTAIAGDSAGHLWVGTRLAGLFQFDRTRQSWERYIPPVSGERFEGVTTIYVDHSGVLWVGYDGAGIIKINPNPVKFHQLLLAKRGAKSGDNFLKPVIVDHHGRLWIGTYEHGLTMVDRSTNERIHFVHDPHARSSLSNNTLLSLAEDLTGRIWIGTIDGVDLFDEPTRSFRHFRTMFASGAVNAGAVWCLAVDSSNTMWAGISEGLLKFDEQRQEFLRVVSTESTKDNWVTCMAIDPDSSLWFGTTQTGVLHMSRSGTIVERFSIAVPNTLPSNFIKCLALRPERILWIGTVEGLCRFDTRKRSWKSFHLKDGLPDETVYGILHADSGTLWFSTNRGLVRMAMPDSAHPHVRNYTPEDGLQSYEFNTNTYCQSSAGEMFFGGINGLNSFFPDSVIDNPHVPPVVLTAFKKFDQPFDLGQAAEIVKSITLNYSESVFSFEFAALEFTNPHRNSYAYMMQGYDRDWVQCGNRREARYTNLDPGEYIFRVRGSNNDGVWNERGVAIGISIIPPFWRTLWFYAAAGVCFVGMFGGVVWYVSVRKIRKQLERLEQAQAIELHRLATREGIARDLHDEVSSTLSSMSLFAESSKLRMRSGTQGAEDILTRLHGMAREAEDAMEQAVWSLSPNHQKLSNLLVRIHDVAIEECNEHDIQCLVHLPELQDDVVLSDVARKNCYLIFREGLANVLRHSGASSVDLLIEVADESFRMILKDNGSGFNSEAPIAKSRGGNGLTNMRSRSTEIGASLGVSSRPGTGTEVTLSMQIAQMRY